MGGHRPVPPAPTPPIRTTLKHAKFTRPGFSITKQQEVLLLQMGKPKEC